MTDLSASNRGVAKPVLVVDLDGTLTPSDSLVEGLLHVIREHPQALPGVCWALRRGRAEFKRAVVDAAELPASALPYRDDLLTHLHAEHQQGRRIVLATAADERIAKAVAAHLGVFDEVLATSGGQNLKGQTKLDAIRQRIGDDFVYAGDSKADLPVWRAARGAILVGAGRRHAEALQGQVPVVGQFGAAPSGAAQAWAKAVRLHQWLKNLLVFVPLLTGDVGLHAGPVLAMLGAFLAFSLLASATYLVNDLLDLPSDRQHPRKRMRPLAAGRIAIQSALLAALSLLAAAVGIAALLPPRFGAVLLGYWVVTTAYTLAIKRYVLLDVLTLAVLYTTRIIAGAAVLSIAVSEWLLAFSAALFLSLALVKRCSELVLMERQGKRQATGRDYNVADTPVLLALGAAAAVSAIVVFGLFISQPQTLQRYTLPDALWLVALALTYWLGRLWVKTGRGEMHDDPLVYTLMDRGCRLTLLGIVAVSLVARFSLPGWAA